MIHAIVLHTGYVEDSSVGCMWYTHPEGFPDKITALKNLAADLKQLYIEHNNYCQHFPNECCRKEHFKYEGTNFCPKCGNRLRIEFDLDAFQEFLHDLPKQVCDSYELGEGAWWAWTSFEELHQIPLENILVLGASADVFLRACVDPDWKNLDKKLARCEKNNCWGGLWE